MLYDLKQPDFIHADERGVLIQLIHEGYKQVNVITSKANTYRGGHYHKLNREAFYVVKGSFQLTCTNENVIEEMIFSEGAFFSIEPLTVHSFHYLEDTVLIGLYDIGVENPDGTKDIFAI